MYETLKYSICNIIRNWYFVFSALGFYAMFFLPGHVMHVNALIISMIIVIAFTTKVYSVIQYIREQHIIVKIVSLLNTLGICWSSHDIFEKNWENYPKIKEIEAGLPISVSVAKVIGTLFAGIALIFILFFVCMLWEAVTGIFTETKLFEDIEKKEFCLYGSMLIVILAIMIIVFTKTNAFYGSDVDFNVIYNSDSGCLVKGNIYFALRHSENDLRQPLFAVFSSPFIGIAFLVGKLCKVSFIGQAILMNCVQIVMLFMANFMLAKMMKLDSKKRVCFMVLSFCTYTQLLFSLMMEQYIVAYFWLILCVYTICLKEKPNPIVLWGAGGTLLTSMVLLPFMPDKKTWDNLKNWFCDMVRYGVEFLLLILAAYRYDIIYNLTNKVAHLSSYTGKSVNIMDKVYQYTEFIHNCFLAPSAGVDKGDIVSWQLHVPTEINYAGVMIVILCIISGVWNRKKRSSFLASVWMIFSFIMLFVIGWGTKENGLILYSLYFGWAFFVLMFQLMEKLQDKLKTEKILPITSVCAIVIMIIINASAVIEMVDFCILYYPT